MRILQLEDEQAKVLEKLLFQIPHMLPPENVMWLDLSQSMKMPPTRALNLLREIYLKLVQ